MPLHDHFRSPVDDIVPWQGFHTSWPTYIAEELMLILPERYVAQPGIHSAATAEIDVSALDTEPDTPTHATESSNGGVATAVWTVAKPTLCVETELPDADEFEVRVYDRKRARRLVAAVELVSEANKDRPEHRQMFVAKCAALLQQRVSVVIVDLVTVRDFNLCADLLEFLGHTDPSLGSSATNLYATACRWRVHGKKRLLETWNEPLGLGQKLPTLPLWLTDRFAVPLELETSYERTCRLFRIK